jgi:uncharacterized protein YxjI
MQYFIQQRLYTFGNDFNIFDASGVKRYTVHGALYSFFDSLTLKDSQGYVLSRIKRSVIGFPPGYKIFIREKYAGKINKVLLSLRRRYNIRLVTGETLQATGSFVFHDYAIIRNGRKVVEISKKIGRFTDCYSVIMDDKEDHLLILTFAIVLDMIEYNKENKEK